MATRKRSLDSAPVLLAVEELFKSYDDVPAVRGVDFEVKAGETAVVMGPSGCGKSTLVRCLNRLIEPDRGRILLADRDILTLERDELARVRRRIGFVFQHSNLIERLDALDNVAMGLVYSGLFRETAYELAREALGRVGLAGKEHRRPCDLSGGERQRVGIARALAPQPELMLWDEPTASLDPLLVREVLDVMEELVAAGGTTMLIVTHEVPFALKAADKVILMEKGRIAETGPPAEVFTAPRSALGAKYRDLIESYFSAGRTVMRSTVAEETTSTGGKADGGSRPIPDGIGLADGSQRKNYPKGENTLDISA